MKNFIAFNNPYLLIEDTKGKYRPIYKEYKDTLPKLNMESPSLYCPFLSCKKEISSATNKKRNLNGKPGFCEFCVERYQNYKKHINSQAHQLFAQDPSNYKEIDRFIREFNNDEGHLFSTQENFTQMLSQTNKSIESYRVENCCLEISECYDEFSDYLETTEDVLSVFTNNS